MQKFVTMDIWMYVLSLQTNIDNSDILISLLEESTTIRKIFFSIFVSYSIEQHA